MKINTDAVEAALWFGNRVHGLVEFAQQFKDIASLQSAVDELEKRLPALQKDVKSAEDKVMSLTQHAVDTEDEIAAEWERHRASLQAAVESAKKTAQDIIAEAKAKAKDLEDNLEATRWAMEKDLSGLSKQITQKQSDLAELNAKIFSATEQLKKIKDAI